MPKSSLKFCFFLQKDHCIDSRKERKKLNVEKHYFIIWKRIFYKSNKNQCCFVRFRGCRILFCFYKILMVLILQFVVRALRQNDENSVRHSLESFLKTTKFLMGCCPDVGGKAKQSWISLKYLLFINQFRTAGPNFLTEIFYIQPYSRFALFAIQTPACVFVTLILRIS